MDLKPRADMTKHDVRQGEHSLAFANIRAHVWTMFQLLFRYHSVNSCFVHITQGFSNSASSPKFEPPGPSDSLTLKTPN